MNVILIGLLVGLCWAVPLAIKYLLIAVFFFVCLFVALALSKTAS